MPPFYTDFGRNIRVGRNVFINHACEFMDRGGIAQFGTANNLAGAETKAWPEVGGAVSLTATAASAREAATAAGGGGLTPVISFLQRLDQRVRSAAAVNCDQAAAPHPRP